MQRPHSSKVQHRFFCLATALLLAAGPAFAGKPGMGPKEQEVFYRALAGSQTEIRVAARDGSNVTGLLKSNGPLNFDVGSRDSGVIIVSTPTGELQKLTYAKNSSGVYTRTGLTTLLSGLPRAAALDLSPDGDHIAYRSGDGTSLMVYSMSDHSNVEWSSGPWAWDFAWIRNGTSIALLEQTNPVDGRSHLYELTGPGQRTEILNLRYMDRVEVSRTDGDLALLSYNSEDGQQTFVGTWRLPTETTPGAWDQPSLAGRAVSNRGVLSCDDRYLIYGSSGHAGAQEWYTRSLPSGADAIITKVPANAEPQSWSACPAASAAATNGFTFREPPK